MSRSGRAVLLLDVLAQDGDRGTADRPGEVGARPQSLGPPVVAAQVRELLPQPPGGHPLRLLTSREMATVGGKFTSRCTCSASPLNSARSQPKSAQTSRMICSIASQVDGAVGLVRVFVTKI